MFIGGLAPGYYKMTGQRMAGADQEAVFPTKQYVGMLGGTDKLVDCLSVNGIARVGLLGEGNSKR